MNIQKIFFLLTALRTRRAWIFILASFLSLWLFFCIRKGPAPYQSLGTVECLNSDLSASSHTESATHIPAMSPSPGQQAPEFIIEIACSSQVDPSTSLTDHTLDIKPGITISIQSKIDQFCPLFDRNLYLYIPKLANRHKVQNTPNGGVKMSA